MNRHLTAALLALASCGAGAIDLSIRFQADPYCDWTMPPEGIIAKRGGDLKLEGATADDKTITCTASFVLAPLPAPTVVDAFECVPVGDKFCRSDFSTFSGACAQCIPKPTCDPQTGSTAHCYSHSPAGSCIACTPPAADAADAALLDEQADLYEMQEDDGPSDEEMCYEEHMFNAEQGAEAACWPQPNDTDPPDGVTQ